MNKYLETIKEKLGLIFLTTLLISLLLITILFFVNNNHKSIKSSFSYNLNVDENNMLLDGTYFSYQDIFSKDFLNSLIETNKEFENINTRKMVNDPVSEFIYDDKTNSYTIVLPLKYFKDNKQAEDFITLINETVILNVQKTNKGALQTNEIIKIDEAMTYEQALSIINYQTKALTTAFNDFKKNTTHSNLEFEDLYHSYFYWLENTLKTEQLKTVIDNNSFIKNIAKTKKDTKRQIGSLNYQITHNIDLISGLKKQFENLYGENGTSSPDNPLILEMTRLSKENILLQYRLDDANLIYNKLEDDADNIAFNNYFDSLMSDYDGYIKEYNDFYLEQLNNQTYYSMIGDKKFSVNTKFNLKVIGLLVVVVAFALTSSVVIMIESTKEN